jgi:hypothetical protein
MIARARLTEYGFLVAGSEDGPADQIKLTGKGHRRERYHQNDQNSKQKNKLFDELFKMIEKDEEKKVAKKQAAELPQSEARETKAPPSKAGAAKRG